VCKIGERVFKIGSIDYDVDYVRNIIDIIDSGFKFVPNWHLNSYDMFNTILCNLDKFFNSLNKKFVINKLKNNKISPTSNNNTINTIIEPTLPIRNSLDIDYIVKKLQFNNKNGSSDINNFKMNNEIMNFRYGLFKHLRNQKFQIISNLTFNQIKLLKDFKRTKPFEIVELDKNIGACIMTTENYVKFAEDILSDDKTYKCLEHNPFNDVMDRIKITLNQLKSNKDISKRLFYNLRPKNSKIGTFRILPKLHKDKFSCRPIVNCKHHATSNLALFLDIILRPFVEQSSSFIKDSQDLMNKCNKLIIPDNSILHSCDFESLYTNIDSNKCINIISEYIANINFKSTHFNHKSIRDILYLVLYNNIFSFNNKFYIQTRGISMGIICGPTLANLYLAIIEQHFLSSIRPFIYYRYIDDIFVVSNIILDKQIFKHYFADLNINICTNIANDKQVSFLDLNISNDIILKKINFSLYVKPTHTNSYLSISTNHPSHIIKNIPKAQFMRIRRICTSYVDYVHFSRQLLFQFVQKGYDYRVLSKTANIVGGISRDSLLEYKTKIKNPNLVNKHLIPLVHDNVTNKLKSQIYSCWNNSENSENSAGFKFQLISTIQQNIKSVLLFKANTTTNYFKSNRKCTNNNCKICKLFNIKRCCLNNQFSLPILDNCSCDSQNIIYVIICKKCNLFYIGESGRSAKVRLSEHLNNIDNYIKFGSHLTEVSSHFGQHNHDKNKDISFSILRKDVSDTFKRKSIEADLINVFKSFNIGILNDRQPNYDYVKHLYFDLN
jgi:hypothetical protein